MPTIDRINGFADELTAIRRDLHAHPEIGFEEVRTSGIVADKLKQWGIEVHRGIGGTGVVGVLKGKGSGGKRIGLADRVTAHARIGGADILTFAEPVGDWAAAGDTLIAYAGCDRRFSTCKARFANAANFRGFPHIPGNDFVMRYPKSGDVLEGQALVK